MAATRVLIVEDNQADVLLMKEALRDPQVMPVEITSVSDAELAIDRLERGAIFDIVILDLSLAKIDGHTFLERRKPHWPPVIVFTSSWNEDDRKRALKLGAAEFLRKPATYQEYVAAVRGIVAGRGRRGHNGTAAQA